MKKLLIGVAAVTLLTSAAIVSANGISSLVGKRVAAEATVFVNGKQVSDAIIIDGKSYAPVKDVVDSMGGSVKYVKASNGDEKASLQIERKTTPVNHLESELTIVESDLESTNNKLKNVLNEIEKYTKQRDEQLAGLTDQTAIDAVNRKYEGFLNERQAQVESINKKIAELEAKRDELRKQLESK